MRSSSGSPCSSSPARVTAAASSRRTNVPSSAWCSCGGTTPSPNSRPARHLRRHRPRLHDSPHRPRGVRPGRRQPGRLLPKTPTPWSERAGGDRSSRTTAVDLTRTARPRTRPDRSPHPPDHPDLRTPRRPDPRRPRPPSSRGGTRSSTRRCGCARALVRRRPMTRPRNTGAARRPSSRPWSSRPVWRRGPLGAEDRLRGR
jgi:hypothetical protein